MICTTPLIVRLGGRVGRVSLLRNADECWNGQPIVSGLFDIPQCSKAGPNKARQGKGLAVVPWFRIYLNDVDQGHSWLATNEEEVLQNFVRLKGDDLERAAQKRGLDAQQYRRMIRIIKERE